MRSSDGILQIRQLPAQAPDAGKPLLVDMLLLSQAVALGVEAGADYVQVQCMSPSIGLIGDVKVDFDPLTEPGSLLLPGGQTLAQPFNRMPRLFQGGRSFVKQMLQSFDRCGKVWCRRVVPEDFL